MIKPEWAGCVGVAWISGRPNTFTECWSDGVQRKVPIMLRYLPKSLLTWDRNGVTLKYAGILLQLYGKKNEGRRIK